MIMARKGLPKFYDVKLEFINQNRYNDAAFPKRGGTA